MPARTCDHRRPGRIARWTVLVAATAALGGCATGGQTGTPGEPTTTQPSFSLALPAPRPVGPPPRTPAAAAATDPQAAAERWLIAYHSLSWSNGSPTAWIDQVKPYVTPSLDATDQQDANAGGGADWSEFVAKQCSSTVTTVGAVIPPEAPGTATAVNVQVIGTVLTRCASGSPDTTTEPASASVVVVPGPKGTWLVNQRLF